MAGVNVRKGMPSVQLDKDEFKKRFLSRFFDPMFEPLMGEIDKIAEAAWNGYDDYRKAPRRRKAGPGFAEPDYDLPVEWLAARDAIMAAEARHKDPQAPSRVLVVNGSSRSDQTCPGEMSKTWRMAMLAQEVIVQRPGFEVEVLDLSRLTSEYGRVIYPCKACVSTAQPLCHWPCSCYPNHAIGQTGDWMNELYPKFVAAHGIMIIAPVNWYQAPSTLKLLIDRLVCADGGNPDPTSTHLKDPAMAKKIELEGWPYPRHLAGRAFATVVHGDAAGAENLRRMLSDWAGDIGLIHCGHLGTIDRYVGYLAPYATSHDDFDKDESTQEDVRNAARALASAIEQIRSGKLTPPDHNLHEARQK